MRDEPGDCPEAQQRANSAPLWPHGAQQTAWARVRLPICRRGPSAATTTSSGRWRNIPWRRTAPIRRPKPDAQLKALRAELAARNVLVQPSLWLRQCDCLDPMAELGIPCVASPWCRRPSRMRAEAARWVRRGRRAAQSRHRRHPRSQGGDRCDHRFRAALAPLGWHIRSTPSRRSSPPSRRLWPTKVPGVHHIAGGGRWRNQNFGRSSSGPGATLCQVSAPYNLERPDWPMAPFARASPLLLTACWGTNWPHPGGGRGDIRQITPYQVVDNRSFCASLRRSPDAGMRR